MGLGTERPAWEDIEWFHLDDVSEPLEPFVEAALDALTADPLWLPGDATRVLLVDLDNLRVEPVRLRARLAMAIALARQADHAAFAGQEGSVRRARPALEEFAAAAIAVGTDHNEADEALLDAADDVEDTDVQFIVVSNDNIFARLALRGPLVVLSPGAEALSERLADAAVRVVDLTAIEAGVRAASRR
jgi:hypothetical protein